MKNIKGLFFGMHEGHHYNFVEVKKHLKWRMYRIYKVPENYKEYDFNSELPDEKLIIGYFVNDAWEEENQKILLQNLATSPKVFIECLDTSIVEAEETFNYLVKNGHPKFYASDLQ